MPSTAMATNQTSMTGPNSVADPRRAPRLDREQRRAGSTTAAGNDIGLRTPGAAMFRPFERRQHRDRRRDRAVAVDQRRAEQADRDDGRPLLRLTPSSDIRARMPPSPSLSTRIANDDIFDES